MTSTRSEAAWADFWKDGGRGPESGCLPNALQKIDAVQRRVWQDATRSLPRGARVLDLATGDGAVLGKIRHRRADLKLVGVDSSAVLPEGLKGATLKPGIAMEALPFDGASFDLVTSQFGFEYGDTAAAAAEVQRVLRPNGAFAFIVHHAAGPIIAHNEGRVAALTWAVRESGLLEKAAALANARSRMDLPTPPSFHAAPAEARRRFASQSVGEEFVTAILHTLQMGRRHPPRETHEVLKTLRAKAENEIARIEALRRAARDPDQIAALRAELQAAGLAADAVKPLHEEGETRPFAWLIQGRKTAN